MSSNNITFNENNLPPVSFRPPVPSFVTHSHEPDFSPFWLLLREMGYSDSELAVMDYFKGIVPLVILAAKNKGVRFEISNIEDGKIISLDGDVMIFRGQAGKLLYDLFKGAEACVTG